MQYAGFHLVGRLDLTLKDSWDGPLLSVPLLRHHHRRYLGYQSDKFTGMVELQEVLEEP